MNQQSVFDQIVAHARKQGKRSQFPKDDVFPETCAYRANDGSKCLVGCLIQDQYYSDELENQTVDTEIVAKAIESSLQTKLDNSDISLLERVQTIHDEVSPKFWHSHLAELGRKFGLKMPE